MDAKQNDPNRYNNRGGQLLREEKERKQTDSEIPKIEKKIKTLAEEFHRKNNQAFLINGVCIIELMEKDWEAKEMLKSARKAIATPGKTTATPRTPLRGQTLTLKRMASTTKYVTFAYQHIVQLIIYHSNTQFGDDDRKYCQETSFGSIANKRNEPSWICAKNDNDIICGSITYQAKFT